MNHEMKTLAVILIELIDNCDYVPVIELGTVAEL